MIWQNLTHQQNSKTFCREIWKRLCIIYDLFQNPMDKSNTIKQVLADLPRLANAETKISLNFYSLSPLQPKDIF